MKMLIGGQWTESSDKTWMVIRNPGTGEEIDKVPKATLQDMEAVVAAAQIGKLEMKQLTAFQRYEILIRIAHAIEECVPELGRLLAQENGKPIGQNPRRGCRDRQYLQGFCRRIQAPFWKGDASGCRSWK